jgi:hypothetical protein
MTQDEIIAMATQVYGECDWHKSALLRLEAFVNLVAAKEQERIIEVVERLGTWAHRTEVVAEIRGEA